ncbi:hypothetical protein OIU84_012145 [Salix udensis]|uniref:Uncharacterized protein n=1 Tax=Salix udensis TaxID=889485 RepID=A0AAD6NSY7_9ROSI|nr:hypothetical protein OIU84_012145 [Salix udensis]
MPESGIFKLRRRQFTARNWIIDVRAGCDACVENKGCKCDHSTQDLKSGANEEEEEDVEDHTVANSSFAHSAINMIGMLIGLGQLSSPYALENGGWASAFLLVGLGVISAYIYIPSARKMPR